MEKVSISTIDVKECRTFLRQLISKIDSPLVFSHNDFNRGNRLVQCDESENKRIYLVDFDYANYFARGQDIGRYFSNYRHKDDMFGDEGFPTDQQMDLFIEEYRKEFAQRTTNGLQWFNDQRNSREKFRSEAKIYAMKAYLDDCLFGLMMFHLQSEEKFLVSSLTLSLFREKNRKENVNKICLIFGFEIILIEFLSFFHFFFRYCLRFNLVYRNETLSRISTAEENVHRGWNNRKRSLK